MSNNKKISNTNKPKFSLNKKILITTLPITLVLVLVILAVFYVFTKTTIRNSTYDLIKASTEESSISISKDITQILAQLDVIGDNIEKNGFTDDYIYSLSGKYGVGMEIYLYTPDGTYIASNHYIPEVDPKTRDWYDEGVTHKDKFELGTIYKDVSTNKLVVTASRLLNDGTIVCGDIYLDEFSKKVSENKVIDGGYTTLIDSSNNLIIGHYNTENIGKNVSESDDKLIAENLNTNEVTEKYGYIICSSKINGTNWIEISYISSSLVFETLNNTIIKIIFAFSVCLVLSSILQIILLRKTIKPVGVVTNALTQMISGDLTTEVETRNNDELGIMAHTLRKYSRSMKEKISNLLNLSEQLKVQGESGKNVSEILYGEAKTQSESMEELRETMSQIASTITEVANNTVELAESMEDCSQLETNINEKMQETMNISKESKNDMTGLGHAIDNIEGSMHVLEKRIGNVLEASKEMQDIIALIKDIAAQTNLLSLNASIESSRAGEAGKGFAVVANEIRQLADRSTLAVEDITKLIEKIEDYLDDTSKATQESVDSVNISKDVAKKAIKSFDQIFEEVQETGKSTEIVKDKIVSCSNIATNMSAISEEQSASVEEVLATVETLTESAKAIATSSKDVQQDADTILNISKNLNDSIKEFKIE